MSQVHAEIVSADPEVLELYCSMGGRADLGFLLPESSSANSDRQRLQAFGDALSRLCADHGFWLRPAHPNAIILYQAYGEEIGYRFTPTGSKQATVDRILGPETGGE